MIYIIKELLTAKLNKKTKTFETNRLLESLELRMGGEAFDLAGGYGIFASLIKELCDTGKLSPVKNSGTNGMNPKLYSKYRIADTKASTNPEGYKDELLAMHPMIKKDYYLKNLLSYEADRKYILSLNKCLQTSGVKHWKQYRYTLNERSFEIFKDEKFLDKYGKVLFKKLGMDMEVLNCYRTYEAFFYIFLKPGCGGNALIIENKDTFMSLLHAMNSGNSEQFNKNNINLLIYGEGNKITKSFEFMEELSRQQPLETVFYYGDIDYPGIDIYQRLVKRFPELNILPHKALYCKLMECVDLAPRAKETSKINMDLFLKHFDAETKEKITALLKEGRFIPQEGLSFAKGDFEI